MNNNQQAIQFSLTISLFIQNRGQMYIQGTSAVRFFANSTVPYLLPVESMLISSTSKISVE